MSEMGGLELGRRSVASFAIGAARVLGWMLVRSYDASQPKMEHLETAALVEFSPHHGPDHLPMNLGQLRRT